MALTDRQILVVHTLVMKLSQKDGLEYMKAHGYDISLGTYKNARSHLKSITDKRVFDMMSHGLMEQHLERIDQLETIQKIAWENYHQEDKPVARIRILETIRDLQPLLSMYYSATQKIIENDNELKGLLKARSLHLAD